MSGLSYSTRIRICDRWIGPGEPVFVIAEAGVAHFGDTVKARELVDLAAEAGADAFKTQAFHTDALISTYLPEWRERLRPKEVSFDFISLMKERCDHHGLIFLCTPHEPSVLPWLEEWQVPAFKIGSGERGNTPFFREIAAYGKPVILSTGMYTRSHVDEALAVFAEEGVKDLALLHCVTSYPTPAREVNLRAMDDLRTCFAGPVGYSDHTEGHHVCLAAVAMGAQLIEKHIALDFDVPNAQDWKVSCGPDDFAAFVRTIREVEMARGIGGKLPTNCEEPALRWALKSLVAARDLPVGHRLTTLDLAMKRPGDGISPAYMDQIIGRELIVALRTDEAIAFEHLR